MGWTTGAMMGLFHRHHHIQTGSRAHPASYPMGIMGKAAEV